MITSNYERVLRHDFAGRTIAITGGAGALGGVMAEALAWAGANIVVLDRSAEAGTVIVEKIGQSGAPGRVLFIPTDVLQHDSFAQPPRPAHARSSAPLTR